MPFKDSRIVQNNTAFETDQITDEMAEHMFASAHLGAYDGSSPEDVYANNRIQHELIVALGLLRPREREVINKRFGLTGPNLTLKQVGLLQDCGKENIRRIEGKALRKLRHPSRSGKLASLLFPEYNL